MRSSRSMWEPTWVSRSRCWLLTGDRLGHVCMSPEPVGSTHLRFGDARVVKDISMQQTEGCSESRMRSRTSREVPDWSGGEELYIGSVVSAIGKDLGVTGIVPGPPDGSRGSTGWGHLSRRAPWAEVGREPAHSGLVRPPMGLPPAPRVGNPRVGGAPHLPWGARLPPGRRPPGDASPGRHPP